MKRRPVTSRPLAAPWNEERLGDINVEIETRHASKAYQKGAELNHLRDEDANSASARKGKASQLMLEPLKRSSEPLSCNTRRNSTTRQRTT